VKLLLRNYLLLLNLSAKQNKNPVHGKTYGLVRDKEERPSIIFFLFKAADAIGLHGKTILVIGTQQPWLEAVLLTK
jgi:hypothetical protein